MKLVLNVGSRYRQALMSGRYQIHTGLQHGIIQNSQKSCLVRQNPHCTQVATKMQTVFSKLQTKIQS